ncbi:hypothetical protein J6590_088872, partial [Homalodisca vitripennis]
FLSSFATTLKSPSQSSKVAGVVLRIVYFSNGAFFGFRKKSPEILVILRSQANIVYQEVLLMCVLCVQLLPIGNLTSLPLCGPTVPMSDLPLVLREEDLLTPRTPGMNHGYGARDNWTPAQSFAVIFVLF